MNQPRIDPDTVEALLDTTWRLLAAEDARTESLDRKAGGLATFASVILSLLAAFASTLLESFDDVSVFALLVLSLACLVGAVGYSVHVLLPKEHLALGMRYVERFPKWSELLKPAEQVRGETMTGLVEAIARGRMINREKAVRVRTGFKLLFVGLAALALDVAILAGKELFH